MSASLSTQISASLVWLFQDSQGLTTIADSSRLEYDAQLSDGSGNNQANMLWHDVRTLAAGAHEDLVLSSLTQSIFGNAVTTDFAAIKALLIVNRQATAGDDLLVGGASTHPWGAPFGAAAHQVRVPADSCLLLVNSGAGWGVSAASADQLRIANTGSDSIDYKVVLIGVHV